MSLLCYVRRVGEGFSSIPRIRPPFFLSFEFFLPSFPRCTAKLTGIKSQEQSREDSSKSISHLVPSFSIVSLS